MLPMQTVELRNGQHWRRREWLVPAEVNSTATLSAPRRGRAEGPGEAGERRVTRHDATVPGAAGPQEDEEPILIRPYVRYLQYQHAGQSARVVRSAAPVPAPAPARRPEYPGRHARTPADIRVPRAPATHQAPVVRGRRRFVAVSSGMLMLALGTTVLALSAARPAAPSLPTVGVTTSIRGHFATAAVPAPVAPSVEQTAPATEAPPSSAAQAGIRRRAR